MTVKLFQYKTRHKKVRHLNQQTDNQWFIDKSDEIVKIYVYYFVKR